MGAKNDNFHFFAFLKFFSVGYSIIIYIEENGMTNCQIES